MSTILYLAGTTAAMSRVCHLPTRPHQNFKRAGDHAQLQSLGHGQLGARGTADPGQAQTGYQVQAENGKNKNTFFSSLD